MRPLLRLTFSEPRHGWWDGGAKHGGDFTPSSQHSDAPPPTIRWGSFELNFWFSCGTGGTWRRAVAYAKRRLCALTRTPATVEVIWEEGTNGSIG